VTSFASSMLVCARLQYAFFTKERVAKDATPQLPPMTKRSLHQLSMAKSLNQITSDEPVCCAEQSQLGWYLHPVLAVSKLENGERHEPLVQKLLLRVPVPIQKV